MGNPVVHFEIMGTDGQALGAFYSSVLGWTVQDVPEMQYELVDTQSTEGIAGGIGTTEPGRTGVTFYIAVPDTDEALRRIETAGGQTAMPTMEVPGVVTFAIFRDPWGNLVGLVKDETGQELERVDAGGAPVAWFELLGPDGKSLREFYARQFGWGFKTDESFDYGEADTNSGKGIPGGVGTHPEGRTAVTVYARVDDLVLTLKAAEAEGGHVVMEPMSVPGGTQIAQFADPQGNVFGLFRSE